MSKFSELLTLTLKKWRDDDGVTDSAALSFHLLLSLPALLLLITSTGSLFLKREMLQEAIISYVLTVENEAIINSLNILFQQLPDTSSLSIGLVISSLLFLWSSSSLFSQLKNIIDRMWKLPHERRKCFHYSIKKRLLSSITVFVFGAFIIFSNLFELLFFGISKGLADTIPISIYMIHFASFAMNFLILITLFMYLYRILPEANLGMRSVFTGAFLTAALLTTGKYLFGSYLRYSNITTIYGSIGPFMGFFLWIYASTMIVTIMIEFTKIHADLKKGNRTFYNKREPPVDD